MSHPANDKIIDNKRDNLDLSPYGALDQYRMIEEVRVKLEPELHKSNPELHKKSLEGLHLMFKKYEDDV